MDTDDPVSRFDQNARKTPPKQKYLIISNSYSLSKCQRFYLKKLNPLCSSKNIFETTLQIKF